MPALLPQQRRVSTNHPKLDTLTTLPGPWVDQLFEVVVGFWVGTADDPQIGPNHTARRIVTPTTMLPAVARSDLIASVWHIEESSDECRALWIVDVTMGPGRRVGPGWSRGGIMTPDWLEAVATVFSAVLLPATIILAIRQWRESTRQTMRAADAISASVYQGISAQLQDIDMLFVKNPELRAYFYGNRGLPSDELERERVMAIAELLVDFMDHIVSQSRAMPTDHSQVWFSYFRDQAAASPAIRAFLSRNGRWYQEGLHQALAPVLGHGA